MNSPDTQPDLNAPGFDPPAVDAEEYFDPDTPDTSEQEFSASLEAPVERPRFVLDVPDEPATATNTEPGGDAAKRHAGVTDEAGRVAISEPISQPSCEAEGRFDGSSGTSASPSDWRDQVSAKVNSYRSRKPRKDRYPSLQLQFEGGLQSQTRLRATPDAPITPGNWIEEPELQISPVPPVTLEATARVLEFPRAAAPPHRDDELADPVTARPRIVEAPELLPPPPALGGILIESDVAAEAERRPGFDMPLQSSPFSRRLLAGGIDAAVVATALAAFAYVFLRINGTVPPWRTVVEAAAALLAVFWPAYQYAFLVFSKTTPGLRLAKLEITRFDGAPASRSLRRWRVLASLLSCASLGLGYAWCFLDEDRLSWHDRITRTHLGTALQPR